ncbi:hypothetical protein SXCC_03590 [Gluconacetobacter sp. SXCC-1]|nr:hypothetical protein SXCC_03590 [Gluconacetobacter sp. SXCC-1]
MARLAIRPRPVPYSPHMPFHQGNTTRPAWHASFLSGYAACPALAPPGYPAISRSLSRNRLPAAAGPPGALHIMAQG